MMRKLNKESLQKKKEWTLVSLTSVSSSERCPIEREQHVRLRHVVMKTLINCSDETEAPTFLSEESGALTEYDSSSCLLMHYLF